MSTTVTTHILPGSPMDGITVEPFGPTAPGGAHNAYVIGGISLRDNSLFDGSHDPDGFNTLGLFFHHGAVPEGGKPCGVTIEALLAACEHRLAGFQNGPWPHPRNAEAQYHILKAIDALKEREREFMAPKNEAGS